MAAVRRLCFGLMLLGMGAVVPTVAYANEVVGPNDASQPMAPFISRAAPLDFEIMLSPADSPTASPADSPAADEPFTYEHTFIGYENEIVVAYWESTGLQYGSEVELYDAVGQFVPESDYPNDIDINELAGRGNAYRLPATGEYRFVFTAPAADRSLDGGSSTDYLLRLRVASFYERAMMLAIDKLDEDDYEASRLGFEMAMVQRPDAVMPYVGRLVTMWVKGMDSSGLGEMESDNLDGLYQLYQSLDAEDQSLVLSDLQQASMNFMAAAEAGTVDADALDFDMSLLRDVTDYFKTGEASEVLQEAMQ